MTDDIDVEALVFGPVLFFFAKMPLAKKRGAITLGLEHLGDGRFLEWKDLVEESRVVPRVEARFPVRCAKPVGCCTARRMLAGHYSKARRAADRVGRVPFEKHGTITG